MNLCWHTAPLEFQMRQLNCDTFLVHFVDFSLTVCIVPICNLMGKICKLTDRLYVDFVFDFCYEDLFFFLLLYMFKVIIANRYWQRNAKKSNQRIKNRFLKVKVFCIRLMWNEFDAR